MGKNTRGNRIPTRTRELVVARDRGQCIACGAAAREIMHRVRRREGGHLPSNLALGCRTCHARCHANPAWAMERGYILSAVAVVDPRVEPVLSWRGWVLLDDEGGLAVVAPRTGEKPPSGASQDSGVHPEG